MKKRWQNLNKTLLVWVLRLLFSFSLLISALIYFNFYVAVYILTSIAGIALIYLLLFFYTYKIEICKNFLRLEKGVIFRTTVIIPYKKIIFIKTLKTPLLKAFGLSAAFVKTINSTVFILEQKSEFLSDLLEKIEDFEK